MDGGSLPLSETGFTYRCGPVTRWPRGVRRLPMTGAGGTGQTDVPITRPVRCRRQTGQAAQEKKPATSRITCTDPELLKTRTLPPAPTLTITKFGVGGPPATTLRLEATGRATPLG